MTTQEEVPSVLPAGVWTVVPAESKLAFRSRGMFGLVPVKGTFGSFDGTLSVDGAAVTGELVIQAGSLDTGNAKRDEHLRSADFFNAAADPTLSFQLHGVSARPDGGHELSGELKIRQNVLPVSAPVEITHGEGRLTLKTQLSVDRAAAGVGWSKMGMIQGPAQLSAEVTLTA